MLESAKFFMYLSIKGYEIKWSEKYNIMYQKIIK